MKNYLIFLTIFFISGPFSFAQPSNDDCSNAERLCNGTVLNGTTTAATTSGTTDSGLCPTSATVWYMFTTTAAGDVQIDFTNMSFNPDVTMGQQIQVIILAATTPCSPATYLPYSTCTNAGTDFNVTSTVGLLANTTYYVQVNGSNSGAGVTQSAECDFDITISGTAVAYTTPTASINSPITVLCQGEDFTVDGTILDCSDTSSFDWYYNNTLISSGSSSTFSTSVLGESGYLKLIANCGVECIYTDTTDSIYFDVTLISADAGADQFIIAGGQANLDGSGSGTPVWSPASSLTAENSFSPIATPSSTTTYFLTVENGTCFATDSVNVFVGDVIVIYSAFTPNGDNINDKWIIQNSATFPNMEVRIYDRSGQQVFQSTGYSTQDKWWDGTNKSGKDLPASTYYYVIDLNDPSVEEPVYKGMVNIIR